jgi:hypothetical protein
MSIFTIYEGTKGAAGTDGINGLNVGDVDDYILSSPLTNALLPNYLSSNAFVTYDRTGEASYINRYGVNSWAIKSSATNFCQWSNDISEWTDVFGYYTYIGTTADPFGGSSASEINLDVDTSDQVNGVAALTLSGLTVNDIYMLSFWVKVISGTVTDIDVSLLVGTTIRYTLDAPTTEWQRVSYPIPLVSTSNLWINPRGLTGARVAIYGVQLENSLTPTDLIVTTGTAKTVTYNGDISKQGVDGWFLEEGKTNYVKNSNDLSLWTVTNGTIGAYSGADLFRNKNQLINIIFDTLPVITLQTNTDPIVEGTEYSVSFYGYITEGSMQDLTLTLGGGEPVIVANPSVVGFQRIVAKCTAGPDENLLVTVNSPSLSVNLLLSYFQVETSEATSVILTSAVTKSRDADLISMDYEYNAPLPSGSWSLVFGKAALPNDSRVKTIFSNGETSTNEFSLTYQNRLLTLNNGGNTSSLDLFDYKKACLTYDGTSIRFYGEQTLLKTEALANTSFIASKMYLGYNSTNEHFNANLSNCMFYNSTLSANDIFYLMGE